MRAEDLGEGSMNLKPGRSPRCRLFCSYECGYIGGINVSLRCNVQLFRAVETVGVDKEPPDGALQLDLAFLLSDLPQGVIDVTTT